MDAEHKARRVEQALARAIGSGIEEAEILAEEVQRLRAIAPEPPIERKYIRKPSEEALACGFVSPREAREIAQRFIDCHFQNAGKARPRTSIPADPRRDDDLRLLAYIALTEYRIDQLRYVLEMDVDDVAGKSPAEAYRIGSFNGAMIARDHFQTIVGYKCSDAAGDRDSTDSISERAQAEARHDLLREVEGWLDVDVLDLVAPGEKRDAG